ncbi:ribonuclease P protein component [Candidatus Nitrosoglobus terrae]|nr:ribonuclease P protein component [Candidatus Nitrosoglobus terrae]
MNKSRLNRSMRLADSADFERVFISRKKISGTMFTVLYCFNELNYPRLGMAISRKHFSRAVDRNRVKRLIRESFRQWQQILSKCDLVVLSKLNASYYSNLDLLCSLENQWICLTKDTSAFRSPRNTAITP